MVEAEATMPSISFGVPKLVAKGFKTGFLDIVELRIANTPMTQSTQKKAFWVHLDESITSTKRKLC